MSHYNYGIIIGANESAPILGAYEYDNKGYCKEREDLKSDFFTRGLVLHVQENYNGYGLSVGPIGYCQNRVIRLEVYYVDDDGSKHPSTIKPQVLGEV